MAETNALLLALVWLSIKHFFADFVFQTLYQFKNKHRYGHLGGLFHVAIHLGLTVPVFWILAPASTGIALLILLTEAIVHYHIDWVKKNLVLRKDWSERNRAFWIIFGFDQLLHMLTYIVILYVLVK